MRHFVKRASLILAAILLVAIVFIILLQTPAARTRISKYIETYLEREFELHTNIGSLNYQFLPLEIEIRDFIVNGKQPGKFLQMRFLRFEIPYSALWSDHLHIRKLNANIATIDFTNVPELSLRKLKELRLQIDQAAIHGDAFRYANLSLNDIAISAKGGANEVRLEGMRARLGSAILRASGHLRSANAEIDLHYEINGEVSEISNVLFKRLPLSGLLRSAGTVEGKNGMYRISGNIAAKTLFLERSQPFSVEGKYSFIPTDRTAPLKLHLKWESFSVSALGSIIDIPWEIGAWTGGSLYYAGGVNPRTAKGSFQVQLKPNRKKDVRVSGEIQGLFADGIVRVQPSVLEWNKQSHTLLTQISAFYFNIPKSEGIVNASVTHNGITATIENGKFHLSGLKLIVDLHGQLPGGSYRMSGSFPVNRNGELKLSGSLETNLKVISLVLPAVQGQGSMRGSFEVHGTRIHPEFSGKMESGEFELTIENRVKIENASIVGSINSKEISVQTKGFFNRSPAILSALIPLHNSPGRIHLDAPSLPLAAFHPNLRRRTGIFVDAVGRGKRLNDWEGKARLTAKDISWHNLRVELPQDLQLHLSRGILTLNQAHLEVVNFLQLQVAGRFNSRDGSLDASLQSSADLELLPAFVPNIEASGKFASSIQINGTLSALNWDGRVELNRGFFRSSALPFAVEDATLHASLNGEKLSVNDFSARVAGGSLKGGGEVNLRRWSESPYRFWVQVRDIGFNYPDDFRTQLAADLMLSSQNNMPLLSGDVVLSHCIITRNIDNKLRLFTTLLLDKIVFTADQIEIPIKLQLQLKNKDPILISNNLGTLQAAIHLLVQGDATNPKLEGQVRVSPESVLFLQTRRFFVERGNIFLDGYGKNVIPRLDLILSSKIPDDKSKEVYEVKLPISGPINNLADTPPQSSPPLLPQEIYFLLLTGRTDAQLTQAESRFMRQQLLAYYSAQMVLPVPEKIPENPSLSTVEIHPELISSERDPGGRILNGKDLFSGISMIYSVPLTRADEQTWIANYRFKKNVAVRFIDQEDGTYSSNVQQNFRFGGPLEKISSPAETNQTIPKIIQVDIRNNTPLTSKELQEILELQEGQPFDYWLVQEKLFELKARLQQLGFLFPSAILKKYEAVGREVRLQISVDARGKSRMIFKGFVPEEKIVKKYETWWREEFSEDAVLGMVRQDLLFQLWLKGYHHASVQALHSGNDYVVESSPGTRFQVKLNLQGAQFVEPGELEKKLEAISESRKHLEVDAIHDFSAFQQKLLLVYLQRGFWDTVVRQGQTEASQDQGTIQKNIEIREGPLCKIRSISVSRNQQFPAHLLSDLKLKVGDVYDSTKITEDELTIARYYEKRGYRNVQVRARVQRKSADLQLVYDLKTGGVARIQQVVLNGNRRTNSEVIYDLLPFKAGDPLVQEELAEAQKRLYHLKLFRQVQVHPDATAIPDRYVVVINLVERGNYELTYSAGFNTEKKLEGVVQLSDWNLFGRAQSLSFLSKLNSEDKIVRLIYHVPDSAGLKWKTLISASYEKLEQPLFITRTRGIELQHQLRFINPFVFVADYRFDRVEVTEKDPTDIYYVGEAPVNVSRLGSVILADTRNDSLLPTKGTFLSIQTSAAPSFLGSQVSFVKNYSQFYHYRSIGKTVWASGIRIGLANAYGDDLIATERFFAGGSFSIRGFEKDQVGPHDPVWGRPMGGEAVFILNQELRFPLPIHEWLYGAVFYDAGNVYERVSDFDPFRLRHSAGLGIRFQTPVGVGRFDWGINLSRQRNEKRSVFHFALGQAF